LAGEWIDISIPLKSGMVRWPGDPEVRIDRVLDVERGDPCSLSSIAIGSHTGTHMDPPYHYVKGGTRLDAMPFDATIGPARVIDIHDRESVKPAELERHGLARGDRILFKTRNSARCWDTDAFIEDFVYISLEGARYLVERGIRTVGVDYLSVGGYRTDGDAVHHVLLEAGIWLIEGLNLSAVQPGAYELVCLPIRIQDADGAPSRAVLRPLAAGGE
jgi:arylformamidase